MPLPYQSKVPQFQAFKILHKPNDMVEMRKLLLPMRRGNNDGFCASPPGRFRPRHAVLEDETVGSG